MTRPFPVIRALGHPDPSRGIRGLMMVSMRKVSDCLLALRYPDEFLASDKADRIRAAK